MHTVKTVYCFLLNCHGLKSKLIDLEAELKSLSIIPQVLLFTETWFDESVILFGYINDKYNIFRHDRNKHGGGVMILIDKLYNTDLVKNSEQYNNIESMWCRCKIGINYFLFGLVYRPPNSGEEYLNVMISEINHMCDCYKNDCIAINGDFNLPHINWHIPSPLYNDKFSTAFVECIIFNSLEQLVFFNTREQNILDLIFCKNYESDPVIKAVPPLVNSDHECISFGFDVLNDCEIRSPSTTSTYNFAKANYVALLRYLHNVNWFYVFSQKNVNEIWIIFKQILFDGIKLYVPKNHSKTKKHKHSIPKHIKIMINRKNNLWRLFKRTNNEHLKIRYKQQRIACCLALQITILIKLNFYVKAEIQKNFFNYVNKTMGREKPPILIKDKYNKIIDNNLAADNFSKFFYSTYSQDDNKMPHVNKLHEDMEDDIIFSCNAIKSLLHKLPNKSSSGPDGISNILLKKLSEELCKPLSILFQLSFNQKTIPDEWRMADVIPIYKGNGSKYDVGNYRPISLTSTISKVMESIIYSNIVNHCNKFNIINAEQHGFRDKRSTCTNLLELLNDLTYNIDIGNAVDLITIDFAKAFDSINHNELLVKLHSYGIIGKTLCWIKEFLNNRSFCVKLNNTKSNNLPVPSSVPQGTKLGPLLFILYINDIITNFKFAKVRMYADDLTIYAVVNNFQDKENLQLELNELVKWANKWQLKINFDKCHVIHMGSKNNNFTYRLDLHNIEVSQCEKILGVLLDCNLTFKEHVYETVKKACKMCNIILMNFKHFNNCTLTDLYKCYVRPILEYVSVVWSPHHIYLIDLIENVQRKFTKRLPGLYYMNYCDRLYFCNLEPLEVRRLHNDVIMLYKILHNHVSVNLNNCISLSQTNYTRGNKFKLDKFRAKLDVRKCFYAFRIINIWNSLNNHVVACSTINSFVKHLKNVNMDTYLKGRAFK